MHCPNCKKPFVAEQGGKFQCVDCGWFERVDNEWVVCSEPAPKPEPEPAPEPSPAALEPNPALLEPDPAAQEPSPDPAAPEPSPEPVYSDRSVKKYFCGLITVTEVE